MCLAAHKAGIKVEAKVHKANEPLNAGEIKGSQLKKEEYRRLGKKLLKIG